MLRRSDEEGPTARGTLRPYEDRISIMRKYDGARIHALQIPQHHDAREARSFGTLATAVETCSLTGLAQDPYDNAQTRFGYMHT
jgi:hypothetical protein